MKIHSCLQNILNLYSKFKLSQLSFCFCLYCNVIRPGGGFQPSLNSVILIVILDPILTVCPDVRASASLFLSSTRKISSCCQCPFSCQFSERITGEKHYVQSALGLSADSYPNEMCYSGGGLILIWFWSHALFSWQVNIYILGFLIVLHTLLFL